MLGITSNEGAIMAIRKSSACPDPKKGVHKCTHCNGDNHVIDTCFKLHGYLDWHSKGKTVSPMPHNPTTEGSVPKSHLVTASGFAAKLGMTNSAINLPFFTGHSTWIIDTGSTDHMTYEKKRFSHLSSSYPKSVITNANGVSSPVVDIGTILLSPSLSINNVLFVPSLNCNLIFVSQLTKSHNCVTTFFPTYCIFQNIHTKERIGSGKRHGGLYYLEKGLQQSDDGALVHVMGDNMLK